MQPAQTRFGRLNLRHQIGGFAFLARERSCISIIAEEEGGAAIIRLTHGVYQANRSASSAPMVRHGVRLVAIATLIAGFCCGFSVRDCLAQSGVWEDYSEETGSVKLRYSRMFIRDGAVVLKDMQDSYKGADWFSGTVVKAGADDLTVHIADSKTVAPARRQPSERTVKVVDVTDLCLNKQHVVNPIGQLSRLQPGQMISVKMRKGTEVAEGINDQGYEVINRLSSPTSGSSSGPAFPACD